MRRGLEPRTLLRRRIDIHVARGVEHDGRLQKSSGQTQAEIGPCQRAARSQHIAIVDQHLIRFHQDIRELGRELISGGIRA
jgi:hypothetical protein